MMNGPDLFLIGLAAVAGGAVNALAGGGTLITFPMLTAAGLSTVAANVTNTVALCPGYAGAAVAQIKDLQGQTGRLWLLIPAGMLGGICGGLLLLTTGDHAFRRLVPYLILFAVGLLASQNALRAWILRYSSQTKATKSYEAVWSLLTVLPAAVYGGYFGAGVSVIVLAGLGLSFDDSLSRLSALKQTLSFSINIAAAIFFLFSGKVVWLAAIVMAAGSILGGLIGGRLAGRISPSVLRLIVIVVGLVAALIYFAR